MPEGALRLFDAGVGASEDGCEVGARAEQNAEVSSYVVTNFANDAGARDKAIQLAHGLPNLRFQGAQPAATVDADSSVRNDFAWVPRARQPLSSRTYQAVPDLRGGTVKPDAESDVWRAQVDRAPTGARRLTETDMTHFEPLMKSLVPQRVEPFALGGDDSRARMRDPAHLRALGYTRDAASGVWTK